ncbi:hypothetical protein NE562_06680 [Butyricicoccus faecihominis]|uniref:hypothetical protein n=1 Tax=Butyricicoccus faecihominis TaxID=1712515 RepID=UPI00247A5AD9|nr:hypothetical protein [Butyricicoccus faecihominis]MCQ5129342.1 hypothetical protein [Butyricicoccus faecihominis]
MAKQNGKATFEHLFGVWQNAKWRRSKEELLAGPPEMRRDLTLMEALRQWIALAPLFGVCAVFIWLGAILLEIL